MKAAPEMVTNLDLELFHLVLAMTREEKLELLEEFKVGDQEELFNVD